MLVSTLKKTAWLMALVLTAPLAFSQSESEEALTANASNPLMTSQDLLGDSASGITIRNISGGNLAITGLYTSRWFYGSTGCTGTNVTPNNMTNGAANNSAQLLVQFTPFTLTTGASTTVGANYLYGLASQITSMEATYNVYLSPANITCIALNVTTTTPNVAVSTTLTSRNTASNLAITCNNSTMRCTAASTTINVT